MVEKCHYITFFKLYYRYKREITPNELKIRGTLVMHALNRICENSNKSLLFLKDTGSRYLLTQCEKE